MQGFEKGWGKQIGEGELVAREWVQTGMYDVGWIQPSRPYAGHLDLHQLFTATNLSSPIRVAAA